jgi:hypothetical protein
MVIEARRYQFQCPEKGRYQARKMPGLAKVVGRSVFLVASTRSVVVRALRDSAISIFLVQEELFESTDQG